MDTKFKLDELLSFNKQNVQELNEKEKKLCTKFYFEKLNDVVDIILNDYFNN